MKKFVFAFLMFLAVSIPATASETVTAVLPDYPVYISGSGPSETSAEYPVLEVDGTLYVPMTYANIRVFGLAGAWHNGEFHLAYTGYFADGNHILTSSNITHISDTILAGYTRGKGRVYYPDEKNHWENVIPENNNVEYMGNYELSIAENPIYINGYLYDNLNEHNPVLLYRGIHYIPINDYFKIELRKKFLYDDTYGKGALYIISDVMEKYSPFHRENLFYYWGEEGSLLYFSTQIRTSDKIYEMRYKCFDSDTNTVSEMGVLHINWDFLKESREYVDALYEKFSSAQGLRGSFYSLERRKITNDGTAYSYIPPLGLWVKHPNGQNEQFTDGEHDSFQLHGMIDGRPLILALHNEISLIDDGFFTIEPDGTLKRYAYYSYYPTFTVNNKMYFVDKRIYSFIDAATGEKIPYTNI